ncbi:MAG: LysM peptidoglycan-binding domain-containing protein [Caldilinea sp.]|nr:LysM peptidoglycan-binding domain-containing protein [Caldilinea sp.]MDW8439485.1 LysM peptidoglycan-binding domain-containing protein [Caldilineaceae bacterium]
MYLSITFALFFGLCLRAEPVDAQEDTATHLSAEAQQIFNDVNRARIDNGLPPLRLDPVLTLAAQRHVDDIIANGNWGHYGSDGSNVRTRAARVGYGSSSVSENWVAVRSPERAIVWWMNDWIHRVNILGGHWDDIGVGAGMAPNGFYLFVTVFGNADGSPPISGAPSSTGARSVQQVPPGGMEYTVAPGDTLSGIAVRYGLDWQDIAIANNLKENDLLQIGQVLRLPSPGGTGGPMEVADVAPGQQRYTVVAGDTLISIGLRYGVAWQELAAVNGLGEFDLLQIGQVLILPAGVDARSAAENDASAQSDAPFIAQSAATTTAAVTSKQEYVVRSGDTALAIALSHNVSLQALLRANNLGERDYLQIGQVLVIPSAEDELPSVASTNSATPTQATSPARTYTVRTGDTVFAIAMRLGVDWQEMLRVNGLTERSLLQPGQVLLVP